MSTAEHRITPGVSSPRRALQLLLGFDADHPRTTVPELATRLNLPTSSVYRYVSLFRELGLLEEDEETSTLQLTPRILPVARAAMVVQDYVKIAQPRLEALCAEIGETVMLIRHSGTSAVCVASVVSSHALRLDFGVGHAFPFGSGATAKVILGTMSVDERRRHLDARCAADPGFASEREAVEQQIEEAGQRGWATSEAELESGVWACSALVSLAGLPPIAVTLAGPSFRLPARRRDHTVAAVREAARAIEAGWHQAALGSAHDDDQPASGSRA
jgi:DNA-binding IclR family transcriptional regulator